MQHRRDDGMCESALCIQEDVLTNGQPKLVVWRLQREAEPPNIVAENLEAAGVTAQLVAHCILQAAIMHHSCQKHTSGERHGSTFVGNI